MLLVLLGALLRAPLQPLSERVLNDIAKPVEGQDHTYNFQERTDSAGRSWGLGFSEALGDLGDLWIVQKVNGKWVNPTYTGMSISKRITGSVGVLIKRRKMGGLTAEQLLQSDWPSIIAKEKDIEKDSDHDGLTDLVEKQLGTDPTKKDTDGDGDADDVDPWPNAPFRNLSDEEQIVAAVFQARFREEGSEAPCLLFARPGVKPFEMQGRNAPTIWATQGWRRHPLGKLFDKGVGFVEFGGRRETDRAGNPLPKPHWFSETDIGRMIEWNSKSHEATVRIVVAFAGLGGNACAATVKKIGPYWFVTNMFAEYMF